MKSRPAFPYVLFVLLAVIATACAGGSGEDVTPDEGGDDVAEEAPQDEAEEPPADEGETQGSEAGCEQDFSGTLTVWHYYDEGAGGLFDQIEDWKSRFEEAHPDVTVDFQYVPYGDMTSKVTAAAAANEGPDVLMPTAPFLPEIVKSGALQPITPYWDSFEDAELFLQEIQDANVIDGERYAAQAFTNIEGVYYNGAILEELGLKVPTTIEEFESAMQAATEAGYTGFTTSATTGAGGEFALVPWLVSAGWSYEEPADEAAKEVFERFDSWLEEGYMSANDATGFVASQNFTTGDYAFAQEGNWLLGTFADTLEFDYGLVEFDAHDRAVIGGEIMGIGSTTADPDLAWCFIQQTWFTEEGQMDAIEAGSIPLRSDMVDSEAMSDSPLLADYAEIAADSVAIPVLGTTGQISELLGGVFNELVAGQISGEEAYQRVAEEMPPLIEEGQDLTGGS